MPSVSASCMAMLVRVPPMSVEPSTSVTMPSSLTLAEQLDAPPMLNQNPAAIPRPRFLPGSGDFQWSLFLRRLQAFDEADAGIDRPVHPARSLLRGVLEAELDRVDAELRGQLVDDLLAGERRLRRAGRR